MVFYTKILSKAFSMYVGGFDERLAYIIHYEYLYAMGAKPSRRTMPSKTFRGMTK